MADLRSGSLFAGVGGGDLAVEQVYGATPAWQLDLVGAAVRRRHWPSALQVEADVRTVEPANLPAVDVLVAGFPCQDLSCAGSRKGLDGDRSGLYREVLRFAGALRARYVVIENVPGLLRYLPRLCDDLGALGYGLSWTVCRALDAGHPHLRRRVFVVAELDVPGRGLVPLTPGGTGGARPWATPTASNPNESEDPASWWARHERTAATSRPISEPLAQQVRPWATPRSADGRSPGASLGGREGTDGLAVQVRLWPTPTAGDARASGSRSLPGSGAHPGTSLTDAVRSDRATADDRPWPTPATRDYRVGSGLDRVGTPPLSEAAAPTGGLGRRLDPDWVEQLMGYPRGWTLPSGPPLRYDPDAPAVRGRYPADWDRTQVWPGTIGRRPAPCPTGRPFGGVPTGSAPLETPGARSRAPWLSNTWQEEVDDGFTPRTTTWDYTDGSAGLTVAAQHKAGGSSHWIATLRVGNGAFKAEANDPRRCPVRIHLTELNMRHLHGGARPARARRIVKAALVEGVVLELDVAVYDAEVKASPLPPGVDPLEYLRGLVARMNAKDAAKRARGTP